MVRQNQVGEVAALLTARAVEGKVEAAGDARLFKGRRLHGHVTVILHFQLLWEVDVTFQIIQV